MHVREQEAITETTTEEAIKACRFTCPNITCDFKFRTKRGMQIHAGKCKHKGKYWMDKILDCKGPTWVREYLVHWLDSSAAEDSWVPRSYIHPSEIRSFELLNGKYDSE